MTSLPELFVWHIVVSAVGPESVLNKTHFRTRESWQAVGIHECSSLKSAPACTMWVCRTQQLQKWRQLAGTMCQPPWREKAWTEGVCTHDASIYFLLWSFLNICTGSDTISTQDIDRTLRQRSWTNMTSMLMINSICTFLSLFLLYLWHLFISNFHKLKSPDRRCALY